MRVFVPNDSAARSVGADEVAEAIERIAKVRGVEITLVRNGTRGAIWLEPLVEVEISGVRHAYGPVTPNAVDSLFDADFLHGGSHPLALGPVSYTHLTLPTNREV